jgi:hypothetical protein
VAGQLSIQAGDSQYSAQVGFAGDHMEVLAGFGGLFFGAFQDVEPSDTEEGHCGQVDHQCPDGGVVAPVQGRGEVVCCQEVYLAGDLHDGRRGCGVDDV